MGLLNELRPLRAYCGDKEVFEDCRIRVRGRSNMTLLPDYFLIEVYNADATDISIIQLNRKMKFQTKNMALLCSGEVEDVYIKWEGTNKIYAISISDGQTFWEKKVIKSVGPGVSFSRTIREILSGATMGSYLARDERFVRPQTFCGRLADYIADIARGVGARAFVSNNVLHVVEKGRAEVIVSIREEDVIMDPSYASGVCIVKTPVRSWPVGVLVDFRGNRYRLVSQEVNADNSQGTWETEITLVDERYIDSDGMDGG